MRCDGSSPESYPFRGEKWSLDGKDCKSRSVERFAPRRNSSPPTVASPPAAARAGSPRESTFPATSGSESPTRRARNARLPRHVVDPNRLLRVFANETQGGGHGRIIDGDNVGRAPSNNPERLDHYLTRLPHNAPRQIVEKLGRLIAGLCQVQRNARQRWIRQIAKKMIVVHPDYRYVLGHVQSAEQAGSSTCRPRLSLHAMTATGRGSDFSQDITSGISCFQERPRRILAGR